MYGSILAQVTIGSTWPLSCEKGGFCTLSQVVSSLLPKIILIGGVIFFILVVITGVGLIATAGSGDAQGLESRKQFLTYAIIGFMIMFGAYWILQIINFITNGAINIF